MNEKKLSQDLPISNTGCPSCGNYGFYHISWSGVQGSTDEIEERSCSKCNTKYITRFKKED